MTERSPGRPPVRLPGWPAGRPPTARAREPLSVDDIVAAAFRVIDAEGLDALSMRRLGAELGAGATSLYWHVRNKDELLDLVLDATIGLAELPGPGGTWRERLRELSLTIRRVLLEHANVVPLFGSRATLGPHALTFLDWIIGVLDEAGFDPSTGAMAYGAYVNFTVGYIVLEQTQLQGSFATEHLAGRQPADIERQIVELMEGLPADRFPNVVAHASAILASNDDTRFAYGLDRLLDGLEADATRRRAATGAG